MTKRIISAAGLLTLCLSGLVACLAGTDESVGNGQQSEEAAPEPDTSVAPTCTPPPLTVADVENNKFCSEINCWGVATKRFSTHPPGAGAHDFCHYIKDPVHEPECIKADSTGNFIGPSMGAGTIHVKQVRFPYVIDTGAYGAGHKPDICPDTANPAFLCH